MPISFPLTPTSPHLIPLPQATGSQLATVLRAMSSVIIGLTIGFYYSWALTLLILAFAPIIFMSGFIRMKLVQGSKKSNDAKALEEAGKVGANNYLCLQYLNPLRARLHDCRHFSVFFCATRGPPCEEMQLYDP